MSMKVFVLGLDGCSWNLLDPWIATGELPNLKALRDEAAWGVSESCLPPVTSPNWKCYSTGKNPGKLGVFWWENIDFNAQRVVLPTAASFRSEELWDYLAREQRRVAIVNMPTTYPPKKVNGVMISGGPDALDSGYTFPPELEGELRSRFAYRVHPPDVATIDDDPEAAAEQILPLIQQRFDATRWLLDREAFDFVHLTIYYINVLQHHLWDHPLVKEAWRIIDRNLGELRESLRDWLLVVMVDHGTNEIRTQFNISTWMQAQGYLVLRSSRSRKLLKRLGVTKERAVRIATTLGLKNWLKSRLSMETRSFLPSTEGFIGHAGRAGLIDWERSQAIPSGQGPVYVNPSLSDRDAIVRDLGKELGDLVDDLGERIAARVWTKDELYWGDYLGAAPDLVIEQADGVHISASVGSPDAFSRPRRWRAENHKHGLFMVAGTGIRPGRIEATAKITDIAPTVLHACGLPVPGDMDGRVLQELFEPGSEPAARPVRVHGASRESHAGGDGYAPEEEREIERRLHDLGYL
ncbi:MAG: alkaline phosphatase family protein [Actinomycetota bacterium]